MPLPLVSGSFQLNRDESDSMRRKNKWLNMVKHVQLWVNSPTLSSIFSDKVGPLAKQCRKCEIARQLQIPLGKRDLPPLQLIPSASAT
jgi:hypothetical protein